MNLPRIGAFRPQISGAILVLHRVGGNDTEQCVVATGPIGAGVIVKSQLSVDTSGYQGW